MWRHFFLRTGNCSEFRKVRISSSKCIKGKLSALAVATRTGTVVMVWKLLNFLMVPTWELSGDSLSLWRSCNAFLWLQQLLAWKSSTKKYLIFLQCSLAAAVMFRTSIMTSKPPAKGGSFLFLQMSHPPSCGIVSHCCAVLDPLNTSW